LAFPTNDAEVCIVAARPLADMHLFRADLEGTYFATLALAAPDLAAKVRAGKREERFLGSGDLPHYFRKPFGPGWVLVGDAGLHLDPTMGLGIMKAFSEVALLVPALVAGLGTSRPIEDSLAQFHARRDQDWVPMAQQNLQMSSQLSGAEAPAMRPWSEVERAGVTSERV
jgi:2-polyprenyl-6-methoxyphenol hydroxylase-like FAD-dependent oxidoreductase